MKLFGITINLKAVGKAAAPIAVAVIAHKAASVVANGGIKGAIAAAVEAEVTRQLAPTS